MRTEFFWALVIMGIVKLSFSAGDSVMIGEGAAFLSTAIVTKVADIVLTELESKEHAA